MHEHGGLLTQAVTAQRAVAQPAVDGRWSASQLSLSAAELWSLCLLLALGPFKIDDRLAKALGARDLAGLEQVIGLEIRARRGDPLLPEEWLQILVTIERLMGRRYPDWQSVTGLAPEETAGLHASIRAKVERAAVTR